MNKNRGFKLVHGVGTSDADYQVTTHSIVNGKRVMVGICPFYKRWSNMLRRCYYKDTSGANPTYSDCTVCEEWLTFSNFRDWMETQDWEGKQLDKDLLVEGNKVYSPETCIFIDRLVNQLTVLTNKSRGALPLGVCAMKGRTSYQSYINVRGKRVALGLKATPSLAHKAWQEAKLKITQDYIQDTKCERTLKGLLRIAEKLQYHIDNNLETTSL